MCASGVEQERWRKALLPSSSAGTRTPGRQVEHDLLRRRHALADGARDGGAVIERDDGALADTAADIEITLEANPTSVEAGRFAALAAAGVNRVSLGVQALDPAALRFLGREHSLAEALAALAWRAQDFARLSFDLIYARPGQTPEAWAEELERALALAGEHCRSTSSPSSRHEFFAEHARGAIAFRRGTAAEMFEPTQARLAQAGLPAYEISNHARPARPAAII